MPTETFSLVLNPLPCTKAMLLLYAEHDEDWRRQQNVEAAAALKAAGQGRVEIRVIGDRDHATIWSRVGEAGDDTAEQIIRFVSR